MAEKFEVAAAPSGVSRLVEIPAPPDLKRHELRDYPLDQLLPFINPQLLYSKHLGFKGAFQQALEKRDPKALELEGMINSVITEASSKGWVRAHAVWKFCRARAEDNELVILSANGRHEVERFRFPRQPSGQRLCLSDITLPADARQSDHVALFVVTTGVGLRRHVEALRKQGENLKCHALQAVAIELAEGFAEYLHARLRAMWGFPDGPEMTMADRFRGQYRGVRVSFGYPACPNLEDQEKLFNLLDPGKIGVQLTEGYRMDPEASASALVFHHPEGRYFNAEGSATTGPMAPVAATPVVAGSAAKGE